MTGYPGGYFRPNQPLSKIEAIVALNKGLNLISDRSAVLPTVAQRVFPQKTIQKTVKRRIFMLLGFTTLMQPLIIPKAQAVATTDKNE